MFTEKEENFLLHENLNPKKDMIYVNETETILKREQHKDETDQHNYKMKESDPDLKKNLEERIELENKMSLIYKIQIILENSKKIIPAILQINNDSLSFLHPETKTEIFSVIFDDVIGSSLSNIKINPSEAINLLAETPIILSYCPKIQLKDCKCCLNTKSGSNAIKRNLKQIHIIIDKEHQNELIDIFNYIALYNKPSKIQSAKKKFLAFVNPTSGRGKSQKKWQEAKVLFDQGHVEIELVRTKYYRHAYNYVLSMNDKKYDGIICISGDGIVHEVINALMHRKDNLKDEIVLGIIPAGTGNGLAKTLAEESKENFDPISFAYMICKGHKTKMDLFEIETVSKENYIYSFHSVCSGLVAEIGIYSESCKCIGDSRYKLYAFWRFLTLNSKHFYSSMYYPEKEELDERGIQEFPELRKELPDKMSNLKSEFRFLYIQNLRWLTEVICAPEPTKYDDGLMDINIMRGDRKQLLKGLKEFRFDRLMKDKKENPEAGLSYRRANFFRYIPLHNLNENDNIDKKNDIPSILNIDGERYDLEPFQMKVLKRCINIYSFKNKY